MIRDILLWEFFEVLRCTYQLVISSSLIDIHEGVLGGHLGVDKSLDKLKERFYWLGHCKDIQQ